MKNFRRVMLILLGLCILPLVCTIAAELIGGAVGCEVDLVARRPCLVAGYDIGGALYVLAMQGYALFFTVPGLILFAAVWAIAELVHWGRRSRKGEAATG